MLYLYRTKVEKAKYIKNGAFVSEGRIESRVSSSHPLTSSPDTRQPPQPPRRHPLITINLLTEHSTPLCDFRC